MFTDFMLLRGTVLMAIEHSRLIVEGLEELGFELGSKVRQVLVNVLFLRGAQFLRCSQRLEWVLFAISAAIIRRYRLLVPLIPRPIQACQLVMIINIGNDLLILQVLHFKPTVSLVALYLLVNLLRVQSTGRIYTVTIPLSRFRGA